MKTIFKIFMLLLFLVAAAGGVMFFYKTQVAPPEAVVASTDFVADLQAKEADFQRFSGNLQETFNKFLAVEDRAETAVAAKLIEESEISGSLDSLCLAMTPKFTTLCENIFSNSSWSKEDMDLIQTVSKTLKAKMGSHLSGNDVAALDKYSKVVDDCNSAYSVSRQRKFTNIKNTKSTIDKASRYKRADYLRNNRDLVEKLGRVKPGLYSSHISHIKGLIGSGEEMQALSDFRDNGPSLYGSLYNYSDYNELYKLIIE